MKNPNIAICMCVRSGGDGTDFWQSLANNGIHPTSLHEVIGAKSMGAGYNQGGGNGDVVIFTHQDVTMWAGPQLWHEMIATALREDVGFVGVAGSSCLPQINLSYPTPGANLRSAQCAWWQTVELKGAVAHSDKGKTYMSAFGPYGDVAIMDGVFLACKRSVLERIGPWPEDLGWHFYDIWATMCSTQLGLRNVVVPLPLLHASIGGVKGDWGESRDLYATKYLMRGR